MPELPEVEVVRAGLAPATAGARVLAVDVIDPRALKRHIPPGSSARSSHGVTLSPQAGTERAHDFERRLVGVTLGRPVRRGKFMWIPILPPQHGEQQGETREALLAHLGMSGQLLLRSLDAADDRHVRIRVWIEHPVHGTLRLDYADQRLFGSLAIDELIPTIDGAPGGFSGAELLRPLHGNTEAFPGETRESILAVSEEGLLGIPRQAAHIARDPLDPHFAEVEVIAELRRRATATKALLLDQSLVSGVGNIYADEALWRARVAPSTPGLRLSRRKAMELFAALRDVFAKALSEGGTSFDAQYVNVNGEAGYFAHSLNVYGRGGEPCRRCGTAIRRMPFAGRSSHFCPRCQRRR